MNVFARARVRVLTALIERHDREFTRLQAEYFKGERELAEAHSASFALRALGMAQQPSLEHVGYRAAYEKQAAAYQTALNHFYYTQLLRRLRGRVYESDGRSPFKPARNSAKVRKP